MATQTRTDIHRATVFVATDYEYIGSFGTIHEYEDSESYGYEYFAPHIEANFCGIYADDVQKCDICGAKYNHGAIFLHTPSAKFITIGQHCTSSVAFARSMNQRGRKEALKRLTNRRNRRERSAVARKFLADKPALRHDFVQRHHIIKDMVSRLLQWGYLSPKQIAFAAKLADQCRSRATETGAVPVPTFTDRVTLQGIVLSAKIKRVFVDDEPQLKMLVEIPHEGGAYKIWGTLPRSLQFGKCDSEAYVGPDFILQAHCDAIKGCTVSFACRVTASKRDKAFGFFSRPTKGKKILDAVS